MHLLAAVIAEHEEELAPLVLPPIAFAGIAAAVFILLGFITWSFRDVSNRHAKGASTDHQSEQH
jgi:hypothetical protein